MTFLKNKYRFIDFPSNDGSYSYECAPVVTEKVLEILGKEKILELMKTVREKARRKRLLEEEIKGHSKCGLPKEIYFKDTITGARISLTILAWETINKLRSEFELFGIIPNEAYPLKDYTEDELATGTIIDDVCPLIRFRPDIEFPQYTALNFKKI